MGVDDISNWKGQNQKEEKRITRASKGALVGREQHSIEKGGSRAGLSLNVCSFAREQARLQGSACAETNGERP
jgi:hypothetical protein